MQCSFLCIPLYSNADSSFTLEDLGEKLEKLAQENAQLKQRVEQLESGSQTKSVTAATGTNTTGYRAPADSNMVKFDHAYAYAMLDPTDWITRKQRIILEQKQSGQLAEDSLYLSGAVTAITDYQKSNTADKFGYLMRQPTSANQRTKEVSEAVIHSAQLALTANLGDMTTAYAELLYDPEQSFGAGTNTALGRNQVQVRRAYALFGNLDKSPFYLALGKMDTPFGLSDTVNPFTASTVWHAFGGLTYGANSGYTKDGWDVNFMAVQGGAQFRGANAPVDKSSVPSKLNNFVFNVSRTIDVPENIKLLTGASYIKGSAYCQNFPVTHFSPCDEANPAYDVYAQLKGENWVVQGEFARTVDVWPGTFNPAIPQLAESRVTSWGIGGKYKTKINNVPVDISSEFSRYVAGPSGAPWERQDQIVLGLAGYLTPTTKLFGEFIHTSGFVPLNNISGNGNTPSVVISDRDAHSDVLLFGVNAAF